MRRKVLRPGMCLKKEYEKKRGFGTSSKEYVPFSVVTRTWTVGLPLESNRWEALMVRIMVDGRLVC